MNIQNWQTSLSLDKPRAQKFIYWLSLSLCCVCWTYYAPMSFGARYGWNFINVFLGPSLALTLFFPLFNRIAYVVRRDNIGSLAEFLAARYGRRKSLETLVLLVSFLGTIPFVGQQLTSLSQAWSALTHGAGTAWTGILFSVALMVFAVAIGARRPSFIWHGAGLVRLIAADAIVKFMLLLLAAGGAFFLLLGLPAVNTLPPLRLDGEFFNSLVLFTAVVFCMPHVFYVAFVRAENLPDLKGARWVLPGYFLIVCLAFLPLLFAGERLSTALNPDTYIIAVSSASLGPVFSGIAFLSSLLTAALLVAVSTLALATMVSDRLMATDFMQRRRTMLADINLGRDVIKIRRATIVIVITLAHVFALVLMHGPVATDTGRLCLSVLVQMFPAICGAMWWRRGNSSGAIAGMSAGVLAWFLAIALPLLGGGLHPWFDIALSQSVETDAFIQRLLGALVANIVLYVTVSHWTRQRLIDRIQAAAFIDLDMAARASGRAREFDEYEGSVGDVKALLAQFLGGQDAAAALADFEKVHDIVLYDDALLDPLLLQEAERILAGVVGAPLARNLIHTQLEQRSNRSSEIAHFLEEAAQAVKLNREMLQATLNNLSQGVCVVDRDFRLLTWNARYVEIFDLGPGVIRVGTSMAEIIRLNRSRSGYSEAETEHYIRRRIRDVRLGVPHVFERTWSTGKILRVIGLPMSDGRYVTSFTDVTSVQDVVSDLRRANEKLEERVRVRTAQLTDANEALTRSNIRTERARASQARFLAAASHDLLQPLHAARLFLGALQEQPSANTAIHDLARNADVSIESANRLLNALLNLSRLEVGGLRPEVRSVDVRQLLTELEREFTPVAHAKGLKLRVVSSPAWVLSDEDLLRSILQNLIGNAIRYTEHGAVLVACRWSRDAIRFEVRDSGPGIPEADLDSIFNEYFRVAGDRSTRGSGLGLSIVRRICNILRHDVKVRSEVGRGSIFKVTVPRARHQSPTVPAKQSVALLSGLSVLCVDDDKTILRGIGALLERWDVSMTMASSIAEALSLQGEWDVILTDYHFEGEMDGLDLVQQFGSRAPVLALITADQSAAMLARAAEMNVEIIRKPVAPAALRNFLARVWLLKAGQE